MPDPSKPIGPFAHSGPVTDADVTLWIDRIERLPSRLREAVADLDDAQLDTPYRPGGWTVRQVAHHIADSHLNSVIRFKLALTEDAPTIKPYDENAWARLVDYSAPPSISLALLEPLHVRWVLLLRGLDRSALARTFEHPDSGTQVLDRAIGMYAWHGDHHVAQITTLRTSRGW